MDQTTVTLIVGLAGIASTLASSGIGFYFVSRSRTGSQREALFTKQLELITRLQLTFGKIRILLSILSSPSEDLEEVVREDIANSFREYSELQDEGSAILPTELWIAVKTAGDQISDMLVHFDQERCLDPESRVHLSALGAKMALLSRAVIGTDELTAESIRLYSSQKDFDRLVNIEVEHLEHISQQGEV